MWRGSTRRRSFQVGDRFRVMHDFPFYRMPSASWGWLWCGEVTNYFVISILQKSTFFVPYVVKTCPFRRNPPQRFSVHSSKRTKFPHFWGQLLRDIAQLYSDLGTLSSTSSSSTPKLQNIRSKVSMTRSSLWGNITKLRTKSKNKGDFLK